MPFSRRSSKRSFRRRRPMSRRRRTGGFVRFSRRKGQTNQQLTFPPRKVEIKRQYAALLNTNMGTNLPEEKVVSFVLPQIAQGTSKLQRLGGYAKIKRITVRMIVTNQDTASKFVRIALLRETRVNSIFDGIPTRLQIASEPILTDAAGALAPIFDVGVNQGNDPFNITYPWENFKCRVIWNKVLQLAGEGVGSDNKSTAIVYKSVYVNRGMFWASGTASSHTSPRYFLVYYVASRSPADIPVANAVNISTYVTTTFVDAV